MDTLKIILGFMLLLVGSQIYWLVVAISGFIVGDFITSKAFDFQLSWAAFTNSIKYSLLGVVLSITAKPMAALASGFVLGGYLSYNLPATLGIGMNWYAWPYLIAASLLTVIFMLLFFAYTYILITAASGAVLIVQNAQITSIDNNLIMLLLFLLGLTSQYLLLNYHTPVLD